MRQNTLLRTIDLLSIVKMQLFGTIFRLRVAFDQKDNSSSARLFLQVTYVDRCHKTGKLLEWKGRKWYLSDHMTDDEIIKTAYAAFKAAVEHEVMEPFTIRGKVLFNPHVSFHALLAISDKEVKRDEMI